MADEETTEETTEEVVVVADEEADTDVDNSEVNVEVAPVVVVEESGGDSTTEGDVDRAVETERRFNDIETQLGAVVTTLSELSVKLDSVAITADAAEGATQMIAGETEAMGEALAETIAEDLGEDIDDDPDTPPETAKRHWWFKSYKELRGKE